VLGTFLWFYPTAHTVILPTSSPGKIPALDYNEDAILYFTTSPQLTFNIRVISEIVFKKILGMASNPVAEV
jgi:hypothetical protein